MCLSADECFTYGTYNKWFQQFNDRLNRGLVWDPKLMYEICDDLRDVTSSNAEIRYEAERDFSTEPRRTLESKVRKLPVGTRYACNGIEKGSKLEILCVYYKPE
ncbi:hypothetical protein COOONC_24707 [Cooperia oncophora]